jgi:hypothetical protein
MRWLVPQSVEHQRRGREGLMRDVKEMVGLLMRALDHAEITREEVIDLEFEADGEVLAALNEAYIHLLEFVYDRDRRSSDRELDQKERKVLQDSLNKIVQSCDISG